VRNPVVEADPATERATAETVVDVQSDRPGQRSGTTGDSESESERIKAVRRYNILDSPPDTAFDRITSLAARACGTPIAFLTVVDTDRIWFKSSHGLDVDQLAWEPGLPASAILHEEPAVLEDVQATARSRSDALVAGAAGAGFYVGVPLRTWDGHNLGTLGVMDHEPRPASPQMVQDLTDLAAIVVDELELRLASRTASALESELRRQAEDLAQALQESLLPRALPALANLDLAARYLPAHRERVGGDFYDAFVSDGCFGLVIGDVCGHGPIAAATTSLARHTVRALAAGGWSPAAVLYRTNAAVLDADTTGDSRFCTVGLVRLDPTRSGFVATVALGGHPHPVILRRGGAVETVGHVGSLVGSLADAFYRDVVTQLEPGDTMVLYTDGLTDADGAAQRFDEDVLACTLGHMVGSSAAAIADGLLAAVTDLGIQPRDDIAVLVAAVRSD
jgi:sigma-B regulation protein RsbU (phosphoserine phosphatase)